MPTEVVMPQMGESIAEGTIVRWIKKVGDKVERDEPLFEISTDKVDAEIPSPAAGVLTEILAKEGETVPVDSVVAVIGPAAPKHAGPPRPQRAGPLERRRRSRGAAARSAEGRRAVEPPPTRPERETARETPPAAPARPTSTARPRSRGDRSPQRRHRSSARSPRNTTSTSRG